MLLYGVRTNSLFIAVSEALYTFFFAFVSSDDFCTPGFNSGGIFFFGCFKCWGLLIVICTSNLGKRANMRLEIHYWKGEHSSSLPFSQKLLL